jgi:hypothetical protein
MRLWKVDKVRNLFGREQTRMMSVLEPSSLAPFLKDSQQPAFAREAEWNRLLSAEMAMATLESRSTRGFI